MNAAGTTNLFVAGGGALYVFTPNNQSDGANGVKVATNNLLAGVQSLHAETGTSRMVVWGINQQRDLFYLQCKAGSEASASAWSFPVPILTDVEQIATFLNSKKGNIVIFAHLQGQTLVQLTQDPVTTHWQQRSILLPSTDVNDMVS
jgi:hypothetical protein